MVAFRELWFGHPINESVSTPCIAPERITNFEGRIIHPGFPVYSNQCAIRMGIALKRAGVQPGQISGCATCGAHHADQMHFIRANEVANAITRSRLAGVGPLEKLTGTDANHFYPKLFGRTGVIYIENYWMRTTDKPGNPTGDHIDVWNGYRSSAKWLMEWFSWAGYYGNYAQAKQIWFWEVK